MNLWQSNNSCNPVFGSKDMLKSQNCTKYTVLVSQRWMAPQKGWCFPAQASRQWPPFTDVPSSHLLEGATKH